MSDTTFVIKRDGKWSARLFEKQCIDLLHTQALFDGTSWLDQEWDDLKPAPIAPSPSYGMVVIDFDNRWIGSKQRYTSATKLYVLPHEVSDLKDRWEAGRIQDPSLQFDTFEALKEHLELKQQDSTFTYHIIPLSPPKGWSVVDFDKSFEEDRGAAELFNSILNAGYQFTDQDIEYWREYLGEIEEFVEMDQAWNALNSYLDGKQLSKTTPTTKDRKARTRL